MSKPVLSLAGTLVACLFGLSAAHAAFTSATCLAKKRAAHGKLQQCRAAADAKILQGKSADLAKCGTKLQEQLAKLDVKAAKAGVGCRYGDNGNGTVTDYDTGLEWEKKENADGASSANVHDVDNQYLWTAVPQFGSPGTGTLPNGTVFTSFLHGLTRNSFAPGFFGLACFAGSCDWRLPTLSELQGIQLPSCGPGSLCLDPVFGSVRAGRYLTSTQSAADSTRAWFVDFGDGSVNLLEKDSDGGFARAVRRGL